MSFVAKCYNGHKTVVDDDLDGETVNCPICDEDFVVCREFEELGKVDERTVPYNTRGFIHMGSGLFIGLFLSYLIYEISGRPTRGLLHYLVNLSYIIGSVYFLRGFIELFMGMDILMKPKRLFFAVYYMTLKKIKFYKR